MFCERLSVGLALWLSVFSAWVVALNPNCAPGGNFDLSRWNLQLPFGSPGSPVTISGRDLAGCGGYEDGGLDYFFSDRVDGSLIMKVPGSPASAGCVTTPNSLHCRTELRETSPGSWDPRAGTNRLNVMLEVEQPGSETVIGQIKIDDSISTKPVCELYYSSGGDIRMGVSQSRAGNQIRTYIGNVPVGQTFSYEIRYEGNVLGVRINNGSVRTLSTYDLNAPRSYFKAGNYNQGSTPSTVRFWGISTRHAAGSTPDTPASPPPASTPTLPSIPVGDGIGPFNILSMLDHTAPPPAATPTVCSTPGPGVGSASTVALQFFSDDGCCNAVQTTTIGNLDVCHNSNQAFQGFRQAVGASMFGRGIKIMAYTNTNCGGTASEFKLTNADQCWFNSGTTPFRSFLITANPPDDPDAPPAPTSVPGTCEPVAPTNPSAGTVSLQFFSNNNCCTRTQRFTIGERGKCHNTGQDFRAFMQTVGANLFGDGIKIRTFRQADCQGSSWYAYDLTNRNQCWGGYSTGYKSFMVVDDRPAEQPGSECHFSQPNNRLDESVTISLFSGTATGPGCCAAFQQVTAGANSGCINGNREIRGASMSVGRLMFGRGARIKFYELRNCGGSATEYTLSNNPACMAAGGKRWYSFRVETPTNQGGGGGEAGCLPQPGSTGANSVTLRLWGGNCGCFPHLQDAVLSGVYHCQQSITPFNSFTMRVGDNMFGRGVQVRVFTDSNCGSSTVLSLSLSNQPSCEGAGSGRPVFRSFMLWREPLPRPAPPRPPNLPSPPPGVACTCETRTLNGWCGNIGPTELCGCFCADGWYRRPSYCGCGCPYELVCT